jgi:hypothetical protein
MSKKIYWIQQSVDEEGRRPDGVTYKDPWFKTAEGFKEYQANAAVSAGVADYPAERWFVPDLYASQKGTTAIEDWDFYSCSGSFPAFSPRAIQILSPYFDDRFVPLLAHLEGHSYYCLRCLKRTDCLNRAASEIEYFGDPPRVLMIKKYAFRQERLGDPIIFAIPELDFELFCTDSIPAVVEKAGLRGLDFQVVDEAAG